MLPDAWTEGYALGDAAAKAVLRPGRLTGVTGFPGDLEAARKVADAEGLQELLGKYGVGAIQSIADGKMDDLAEAISGRSRVVTPGTPSLGTLRVWSVTRTGRR